MLLALTLGGALIACGEAPEERLAQARTAADRKDTDAFRSFFTEKSAELMRDFEIAGKRSKLYYTKDPFALLPGGDIDEVFVKDNLAVITVKDRGKKKKIRLYMENGQWAIDLFSLETLWEPLEK